MASADESDYKYTVPIGEQHNEDSPLYKTDEFRMYCFKILPCSKRYCHDWTTCPFAHPGEKAKRRDPRVHTYTGVACPDMKKNLQCLRADSCPYAHNVFEYYLHPSRYRTQLCNDGVACRRKVCFFAHTLDELRVSSVKVLPAELGGRLPAPEADPFRNTGQANNGKYDRDRRLSNLSAAPRSSSGDMGAAGASALPRGLQPGQQPSPLLASSVSPLAMNMFDSSGGGSNAPSGLRHSSSARPSGANGNSSSPAPTSHHSCGQVHFGAPVVAGAGRGFNAPKVPSMQQQQQEWYDSSGANPASGLTPELQALLRGHQQHSGSNSGGGGGGGAPLGPSSASPSLDLMQMAQLQQLAAAQAQLQALQAQQHQQQLMEQLAASLTQLQLSGALPQHSLNDVVGLLMQQMTAAASSSAPTPPPQQMMAGLNLSSNGQGQQGSNAPTSAAAQLFASNSGGMMMASASQSQSGPQQQHMMQQQQWNQPPQHPSNGGLQQQQQQQQVGDLRSFLSSSAAAHLALEKNGMGGNNFSYSTGPAMTGMGGVDARYANFMQGNNSASSAHQASVLRSHTNPLPVIDGPLNQAMLARYSFGDSAPAMTHEPQGPISHQELLELANCSNSNTGSSGNGNHEYSMGDVLCPLRPFPQASGYNPRQPSDGPNSNPGMSSLEHGTFAKATLPLPGLAGDTASADTMMQQGGSLSPATYTRMFPARNGGSQGSAEPLDQGFCAPPPTGPGDLSGMDPAALFARGNYGRAPQIGGPKRSQPQQPLFHQGYHSSPGSAPPGPPQANGNNGNNGIVFQRSSVESRSDRSSERYSLDIASANGNEVVTGGHGVRSMSSEDSFRLSMGQMPGGGSNYADSLSAAAAASQRRSLCMNLDAAAGGNNPWATAAAIKSGMVARGSTGGEYPGQQHSKFTFANAGLDAQEGGGGEGTGSGGDNDEVLGLRQGLDALAGSLRL